MHEIEIYNNQTGDMVQARVLKYHENGTATVQIGRDIVVLQVTQLNAIPGVLPLEGRRVWIYNKANKGICVGYAIGQHLVEGPPGVCQLYISIELENGAIDMCRAVDVYTKPPATQ